MFDSVTISLKILSSDNYKHENLNLQSLNLNSLHFLFHPGGLQVRDGVYLLSPKVYWYNTKCHRWIPHLLPHSVTSDEPYTRRLSHTAMMVDQQTMLLIGGYNGVMLQDMVVYRLPKSYIFINTANGKRLDGTFCYEYEKQG